MRICKVRGCKRKNWAKGYCHMHHQRRKSGKPITKRCEDCKRNITNIPYNRFCKICGKKRIQKQAKERSIKNREFVRKNYVHIPAMGSKGKGKGKIYNVFTNGVTEEMKPLVSKIRDKVLRDCIKNPRKYLK